MQTQRAIATGIVEEFEWDYRNRLTSIITRDGTGAIAQQVNYVYDVMGRRIAKTIDADGAGSEEATTTHFVYDGNNVLMEFVDNSTTPSQRYLHGPQVDQVLAQDNGTGQPQWLLADHLGTIHDVIDNSGTILNHITFDSFGNVLNQTDNTISTRYLFTGREFDTETGLYYYRARYYNPELGQFISQDPINFWSGDTNLYRYVFNSPQKYVDPSGMFVPAPAPSVPSAPPTSPVIPGTSPSGYPVNPNSPYYDDVPRFELLDPSDLPSPRSEQEIFDELYDLLDVPIDPLIDLLERLNPNQCLDNSERKRCEFRYETPPRPGSEFKTCAYNCRGNGALATFPWPKDLPCPDSFDGNFPNIPDGYPQP